MIKIQKQISFPETYPLSRLGNLEDILFFDIETTGFSGDYSNLYLIGCVCYREGAWQLIQWFADRADSEVQLLHAFFDFLVQFKVLVHFNGDGFDIPYLLKRCRAYGLSYDFSGVKSIDIYKRIKPYKNLLQLDSLKQKAIESFLGISRKDMYSGGQLIEVYQDYLISHDSFLYDLLILHNEDDLKGMPLILPILSYSDLMDHEFTLSGQSVQAMRDIFGKEHPALTLNYQGFCQVPVPFSLERPQASCQVQGEELLLTIPLYHGSLKYFYPDYKDYYYLIYEDTAIHKSIGEFVDKSARKKATAKTCYTKKEGCFLPQFGLLWQPALMEEYKARITYVEYREELFQKNSDCDCYLRQVLEYLTKSQA